MMRSETITKITAALLKVQKELGAVKKTASNPFFNSKYSDLNAIMEVVKEPLNNANILILQPVGTDEHGDFVETTLIHESGEWLSSKMALKATKEDMQAYGSAVSYARRYTLQSLLSLASEDDDGNAVSGKKSSGKVANNTTNFQQFRNRSKQQASGSEEGLG